MTIEISKEVRFNALVDALEGGSNYWYYLDKDALDIIDSKKAEMSLDDPSLVEELMEAVYLGAVIPFRDLENRKEILGYLSLSSMDEGESLMFEYYPDEFIEFFTESGDAGTADIWLQFVVLKELVYG